MVQINSHFSNLSTDYLFPKIEKKVSFLKTSKKTPLINLGIGDIALPLAPSIVTALQDASEEMGKTLYGYGPAEGYPFLREKIAQTEYTSLSSDEIFISDGINRDICDILDVFDPAATIGITDPTYPVYSHMGTLLGKNIYTIPCLEENGFEPLPPQVPVDLIYLCSPNNPTGVAMQKKTLQKWVDFAKKEACVLLFDAAYQAFITSPEIPKTIYEIPGAKEVAIEFKSFSKSAGFTALRLGYTVIPKELGLGYTPPFSLNALWKTRQNIKSNGTSFPIQKAGLAALSDPGKQEIQKQLRRYLNNGKKLKKAIQSLGFLCYGGENSPYLWWKIPYKSSWEFFDLLLQKLHLITIPGEGFGPHGEGYVRLSSFLTEPCAEETVQRLSLLEKFL